jgi:hypothetical protein
MSPHKRFTVHHVDRLGAPGREPGAEDETAESFDTSEEAVMFAEALARHAGEHLIVLDGQREDVAVWDSDNPPDD